MESIEVVMHTHTHSLLLLLLVPVVGVMVCTGVWTFWGGEKSGAEHSRLQWWASQAQKLQI